MSSPERSLRLGVEILADDALGRAFARLSEYPPNGTNVLRDAIRDFVDRAKARGESPERVIIALKTIAHQSGLTAWRTPMTSGANGDYEALADAVTWCIERYFEGHTSERDRPA